jgi:Transglycosylase SLT domain
MILNEQGNALHDISDRRPQPRPVNAKVREQPRSRTIVIRQHGSSWQSLAFLCLCLLLLGLVLMGHQVVKGLDVRNQENEASLARAERKIQQLESGMSYDSRRRHLLLAMRNRILKTNPKVSLTDSYYYARLALEACEKYPAVDPLLLLAIGVVESGYDPLATSRADARGLYQIWPSTGRLLVRSLGWNYDDSTLFDPEKNTEAAALYLDILFATYSDPTMVLAEYNGGPLNAGFYRAGAGALAAETRNYVPRVLELYALLKQEFENGTDTHPLELGYQDVHREGKTLGASTVTARTAAAAAAAAPAARAAAPPAPASRASVKR